MWNLAKTVLTVRWCPGKDTITALLTAVAMLPVYYLGVHGRGSLVGVVGFVILGNGILNVLFPAYYLLIYRKESPSDLGLTKERLWLSLAISVLCSALFWPRLLTEIQSHPNAHLTPHLLYNGLALWEPFFLFGWIQLRFERAFGILPGIIVAAALFGAFHLSVLSMTGVGTLVLVGLLYAALFRICKNILAVWPLAWTAGNSIVTLHAGLLSGWGQAVIYGVLLVGQIVGLIWMVRSCRQPALDSKISKLRFSPRQMLRTASAALGTLLFVWAVCAYVMLPAAWRSFDRRHPALTAVPRVTRTANGIPGDPLNVALVGTEEEIQQIMLVAKWFPADPITLRSSLRIAAGTVFRRSYDTAPVSDLYLWNRKQDLAFQQPVGGDPRRRHHVRFWKSEEVDEDGRPLWIGAATFDSAAGLSLTTGQITHHIEADIDAERNKLTDDLNQTGLLSGMYWQDDFHERREGHNGGGDPYYTDGRLAVGVVAIGYVPFLFAPAEKE
ncbi:MAG: LssY C-terminal domain-containing protein [Planctomycetota bacterium]|nr:LssY C-terminal domain-containing protein [Planctomycetota bacterium]